MREVVTGKVKRGYQISVLMVLLSVAVVGRAQQQPPPDPTGQEPKRAGATSPISPTDDVTDDEPAAPAPMPPPPVDTQMRVLGKAAPYTGFDTPLRWGPFSVAGADLLGVEDWYTPGQGAPNTQLALGLLRTNLDFDVVIHRSHLILQYSPEAVIQNGQINATASSNNDLAFGMTFQVTPRFTMLFRDEFTYNQTKQVFSDQILQIYQGAGGILPGDFLQNNGTYMSDIFSAAFGYKLSPRWTLTDAPLGRYINLQDNTLNYKATGVETQNLLALTYALSPRSNFSIGYNFQEGHTFTPTITDSYFHGLMGFYSLQVTPTFWIQGNGGAEVAFYGPGTPPVFFSGGFSTVKMLRKTSFALTVTREKDIENYYTDRLDDRADVSYSVPIGQRIVWRSGGGYYEEIGAEPHTQGKYAQTSLDVHLTRSIISFANYTFRFQHADTLQLINGTHNTVIFGLRWQPAALVAK